MISQHWNRGRGTQPSEPVEHGRPYLQLGDLAVEVTCHDAFAQKLEAAHFGLDETAPMIAAPLLPDRPAQPARGVQYLITSDGTTAVRFP